MEKSRFLTEMLKTGLLCLALLCLLTPQVALSLPENTLLATSDSIERPLICILVNSPIYAGIKSSLDQYAADVENSGFEVKITESSQLVDETPTGIRRYLQENMRYNLIGCLLVGDISEAWFEIDTRRFPIDLYYMDLDGVWTDSDNNKIYDGHSGNVTPEIWVGRLKVPETAGDETSLLNNYFDKNHRYRTGRLTLPWWRSMIYIDDGGTSTNTEEDAINSLSKIYSDITFVNDRATTNATDYKKRILDPSGYQWIYLMCHGSHNNHTFTVPPDEDAKSEGSWFQWDGTVYSSDYKSINPRIFFYHFVVCSAAKYSEPDYLAGLAVFGNDYGLLALGSTQIVSTLPVSGLYEGLSEGKCVGKAFLEWSTNLHEEYDYFQRHFYGLTLIGDPTLQLHHEIHDVAVTDLHVSLNNVSGEETLTVEVEAKNQGEFSETFDVAIYFDFKKFRSTNVALKAGAATNLTFNFTGLNELILGYHFVEAKATFVLGELEKNNNVMSRSFKGIIVNSPVTLGNSIFLIFVDVIAALSIFVAFGLTALALLKILMSERLPRLRSILRKRK